MTYKPNPIYEIFDDWGDNLLTGRQFSGDKLVAPPDSPLVRCKNFRPEWTTESGSPSASGGVLDLVAGDTTWQVVSTPTTFFVGTWEIDFQKQADGTSGAINPFGFLSGGSWKYSQQWKENDVYSIYDEVDGTDIISATIAEDTAWHTGKVTRDSAGNWELFFDGTSQGTTTDTTTSSIDEFRIRNWEDIEVYLDNLKIR